MAYTKCRLLLVALALLGVSTSVSAIGNSSGFPPIPIGLGGKEASITKDFIRLMLPEYDVIHAIQSAPNGKSEFPPLLAGEQSIPVSGLGSNFANAEPQVPRAIFIGGGFSPSEINEMYGSSPLMQSVPWLSPAASKRANGTVVPPVEVIVARVKEVFAEHGFVPENSTEPTPEVWQY